VKPVAYRTQLWFAAVGYAAVFAVAACLIFGRYLLERNNPDASGGMFAAGDAMLAVFIAGLFMLPTVFLVWVMAKAEALYKVYSQFLLGLSLSAPVCLGLFVFGEKHVSDSLRLLCLGRLVGSPFIFVGIAVSRVVARFDAAKKLTSYALLIEGLTLCIAVAAVTGRATFPKQLGLQGLGGLFFREVPHNPYDRKRIRETLADCANNPDGTPRLVPSGS